jgi:hypothetical protein
MLSAVDLDNQTVSDRCEVSDIGSNRALSAKFVPGEATVTKQQPQPAFGVSLVAS